MMRLLLCASLAALASCGPADPEAGTEQLRASVDDPMRRAGVSQGCIDSLDIAALGQARAVVTRSPRSMRERLQQDQRLRTIARTNCGEGRGA